MSHAGGTESSTIDRMLAPASTVAGPSSAPRSRHRWWQFSLRTLLIGMVVISLLLAALSIRIQRARRQATAVATIRKLGGFVDYDFRFEPGSRGQFLIEKKQAESPVPAFLLAWAGQDFFHNAITTRPPPGQPASPADVKTYWNAVSDLRHLEMVQAQHAWVDGKTTTEAFRNHRELRHLLLMQGKLSGEDLAPLSGLGKLRSLSLAANQIDGAGLKYLAPLESLEQLTIWRNQIDDNGVAELAKNRSIKWLELQENRISAKGAERLGDMAQLQRLNLGGIPVTDDMLVAFGKLASLEHLELELVGDVTDRGLTAVCQLRRLKSLSVGGEGITDAGVAGLENLNDLTGLGLSGKGVTDQGLLIPVLLLADLR